MDWKSRYLDELLGLARGNPEYASLVEYLIKRDFMPAIEVKGLPEGVNARLVNRRTIEISPESRGVGSLTHELTHAAAAAMADQYFNENFNANNQFADAFRKMVLNGRVAPGLMGLNKNWVESNKDYRTAANEIYPMAVGNQVPESGYAAPLHFDTTAAQEFMILLDLANRETSKKKKPSP